MTSCPVKVNSVIQCNPFAYKHHAVVELLRRPSFQNIFKQWFSGRFVHQEEWERCRTKQILLSWVQASVATAEFRGVLSPKMLR